MKGNYGWTSDIYNQAFAVVECLGGGEIAYNLILETSATETALGTVTDGTVFAGMGICQFDKKPFQRIRAKSMRFRKKILNHLGVDIKLVQWEHLRYDSFLSLIFCRLYYMNISRPIPEGIVARAGYWKKYYNSYLGKGTPKHYLQMTEIYLEKNLELHSYVLLKEKKEEKENDTL